MRYRKPLQKLWKISKLCFQKEGALAYPSFTYFRSKCFWTWYSRRSSKRETAEFPFIGIYMIKSYFWWMDSLLLVFWSQSSGMCCLYDSIRTTGNVCDMVISSISFEKEKLQSSALIRHFTLSSLTMLPIRASLQSYIISNCYKIYVYIAKLWFVTMFKQAKSTLCFNSDPAIIMHESLSEEPNNPTLIGHNFAIMRKFPTELKSFLSDK